MNFGITKTSKRIKGILSAKFIVALILILGSAAANAQTVTLTTTVDAVDGNTGSIALLNGTPGGAGISLREAILAANNEPNGSVVTINMPAGTFTVTIAGTNENLGVNGDIDVNVSASAGMKTVTINGAGAGATIITGSTSERVFDVHAVNNPGSITFNLSGVTISGTSIASASGAALLLGRPGDISNISNCIFSGNSAPNSGAISQSSSLAAHDLTVTNCTFINNTATSGGPGALNYNGIGNVTITGCTFSGNTAATQAGAINITGGGSGPVTTNILRNTFSGNTANGATFGGAVVAVTNAQTVNINFNRILGNNTAPNVATGKKITSAGGVIATFNTDNNWWGVNTGPAAANVDVLGSTTANWLQLKASASPSTVCTNTATTVTASFLSNSANNAIAPANLTTLIGQPITFTNAVLGVLSSPQPTIQASGTATVTYTSGGTNGAGSANAVVDNVPNNDVTARASITVASVSVTNPGVTTGTTGVLFSQNFTSSGGTGPYTFTTASTLPTGLTLSAAGVLSGTPTQSGLFPIVVTATDVNNCSGSGATYNLQICSVITVTNPANATGTTALPFSETFTSTGGTPTLTYSTASTLPAGLTLSAAGVLSGTPTATGTFPIVVDVTDANLCTGSGATYTLIINTCGATAIATPSSQTTCSGSAITSIVFTGTGTTFNWTRDNTVDVTGIAASGSGNISGTLTNITAAPITVTFTIIPNDGSCNGAPITATVIVSPTPTTANAGPDATACISPGTFTMAANVPAVGTGTWSQLPGGPATAFIFTTGSATTNIGGLTTAGIYTFRWTITSGSCPASFDEMTITVNPNPAPFTLAGGGTFCPGTTTLTGPIDPNYTYTWQRSLSGIANPNSFTSFGGNTSTQDVTSSGNYRLIVTNQFGCSTSDTTPVSMADFVFNGSLGVGDAQQTGRLNRFAAVSTCAAPKACPLTFTTTGARFFDSYTVTNIRNVPVCATIGLRSDCGTSLFNVAYLGSFNSTALCTNYLADPGSSFPGTGYMEVTIPANATIEVIVHEVNPGTGCASYQLTVDVPREAGVTVNPSTPICSATPVTLTAPVASSYSWNPGGNTTQAITVSPAATTEYFVTLGYGNNGCTGLDSATVTINPLPTTADAGLDAAVCGLTYTLAGNTPTVGTGTWTLVTGPGTANFTNANLATSDVTVTANGVYTFRWTIATGAPCPNSAQDDVIVNFAGTPSVADAGLDKTACVSPGSAAMTAAVPTAGTGVWTQVAGPVTANIISPSAPNTNITGLNTVGTYTFRWTVSNNPCPSNFDEVNVVVNGNPASFTITGGGTFCPSGTTLAGPVDPNYTYQWGKSYLTAPFTNVGTGQTQAVTSSGIYQLVVTNQFGCSTSATTVVNTADYVFNGSLVTGDALQTGRLNRFAAISTCAAPKVCPGTFTTTGSRLYDTYTITNPRSVPVCAVIGLNSGCGTAIFSVAYSGSYDPNALCTNYLADPGSSPSTSIFYEATIPGNSSIVIVVHEVNPGTGCANYTLTVDVPRDLAPIIANPPSVLCNGISTLTAPVANSYLWSPGGATTRSIVTPPLFVPTQFNVTLGYGNNGCNREDSVTVGVTSLPPTIICPANISLSNTTGQCGRIVTYSPTVGGLPTPTEIYTFTGATTGAGAGNGSGSFFNIGTTTVEITATNACGTVSCTFTVTINDTENPTITCPVPVTVSCAAAVPVPNTGAVTASDNCPGYVVTHQGDVISGQTCANRYTVTRTYRVTDPSGNFAECTQIITVNDQTPPVLTCPTAVTVSCASAVPPVNIAAVTGVSDNCAGVVTVTHRGDVISAQTCANRFTITRTYRATDVCGNFAECTQIITVNDQTPPVLTCPAPITVSCASAVPAVNIASVTGVSDNCAGVVTVTHQGDVISGQTCANRFTITRTYRATDVCGNFAECTQIITVNDQTAPVVTCPAPVTVSCASAVPAVNIASVTATDNCAGVITITHVGDVISNQTCLNRFTITRTYRATDVCGNSATCTQIITVNDQTAPVITCSPNLTATTPIGSCTAVVNFTVTATDNCAGPVTIVSSPASGTAFPIGVTTVTSTATDACGNSSTCTFTVTVIDGQLPVISSQPANRTICSGLNASFSVTATNVVTYQWQQWNGSAWVNVAGANAATFTLNGVTVSQNTNTYRVVLNGLCTVVNSNAATLYVNPPSTVTIAAAPPAILPNQTSTLTASGVPPGGTYAWTLNGAAVAGVTGAVLGPLNINQLGTYRVVYTSPAGCISTSTDLTITGAVSTGLWVYPNPNVGQFQVRFYNTANEAATVNIYDALGQKIYQRSLVTGGTNYSQIDVDLGFKANGIYIVEVVNGAGQRIGTRRINVQSK